MRPNFIKPLYNSQSDMTKKDFIERLYITQESEGDIQVTFNDTYNYTFVRLEHADPTKVELVFNSQNPSWSDVRSLMHDVREKGIVTNWMKLPVRYPIANI